MNATIQNFIDERIEFAVGAEVLTTVVRDMYVQHTGATKGKLTLYKMLVAVAGVRKDKKAFYGLKLKQQQQTAPMVAAQPEEPKNELSAYEQEMLKLQKEKMQWKKELKAKEMEQEKELKAKEMEQEKEQEKERLALKAKEMEQKKEQEKKRLALEQEKIDLQMRLKELDIEDRDKDRQCMIAEKEKDRAFMEKENNKYRVMYVSTRFNRYTDFELYGTPSCQYISDKSMRDVLAFSGYRDGVNITNETVKVIERNIAELAEPINVVDDNITKEITAINVNRIDEIATIAMDADISPNRIKQKLETIKQIASSNYRYQINEVDLKLRLQDNNKYKTAKDKRQYVKARNNITFNDGRIVVNCFCCDKEIDLNSSACHRSHDIAQSKGGDWSDDNIYLCCANCNQDMGDELTVIEYAAHMFNTDVMKDIDF